MICALGGNRHRAQVTDWIGRRHIWLGATYVHVFQWGWVSRWVGLTARTGAPRVEPFLGFLINLMHSTLCAMRCWCVLRMLQVLAECT